MLRLVSATACAATLAAAGTLVAAGDSNKKKPSISLKASPAGGFSPLRVVFTAEVKGGDNDFEEYYCPTVEWYWGDDTRSEAKADCDPYEPGKSEIKRRYATDHTFQTAGEYNVEFRLKQKDRTVGVGRTLVRIRPGIRDCCDD
jgi:plastocyanin